MITAGHALAYNTYSTLTSVVNLYVLAIHSTELPHHHSSSLAGFSCAIFQLLLHHQYYQVFKSLSVFRSLVAVNKLIHCFFIQKNFGYYFSHTQKKQIRCLDKNVCYVKCFTYNSSQSNKLFLPN